ncbi:unnamed protein product [Schistocephalus solidus]|uniref:Fibronectin type III domain protein n=1 Tax=Schistocephalus solidus TaxID=70667 RepID=A0A183T539_SCHSO|nr:unnamed protein product [Schistocephalus solidus]
MLLPVRAPQAPSKSNHVTGTAFNSTAVHVEWDAPLNSFGEITMYRISGYDSKGVLQITYNETRPDVYSAVLNGFQPLTTVYVEVQAYTKPNSDNLGGGFGQNSQQISVTLKETAFSPPVITSAIATRPLSIALTWTAPNYLDVIFERYEALCYRKDPSEPTQITVTAVNSTAVQVNWKAPYESNGEISMYQIRVYDSKRVLQNTYNETGRDVYSFVLNGFQPYTTVYLAVRAYTQPNTDNFGGGFGRYSQEISVTLKETAPTPPEITSIAASGPNSIKLTWTAPMLSDNIKRFYKVECYQAGENDVQKSIEVNAGILSGIVSFLRPNTLYECAVIACPLDKNKAHAVAEIHSRRSSTVRTWPGKTLEPTQITVTAVNSTAVQVNCKAPYESNGETTMTAG